MFSYMGKNSVSANSCLGDHLRGLRVERGLSLQELADHSGVSRATLSRIETSAVSPTAESLGRIAAALGLPISRLLAPMEPTFEAVVHAEQQLCWDDPASGMHRRIVSPRSSGLSAELVEVFLEAHQSVAYPSPPVVGQEHHLLLVAGRLTLTLNGGPHALGAGDCIRYRLTGPSRFETGEHPARYLLILC